MSVPPASPRLHAEPSMSHSPDHSSDGEPRWKHNGVRVIKGDRLDPNTAQIQEVLKHDPLSGHLFCFRGRRGDLLKVIWHDGQGACLFTKRLERGRFLWPSPADGAVTISPAQLSYLLSGIDWRAPQETWRPTRVG